MIKLSIYIQTLLAMALLVAAGTTVHGPHWAGALCGIGGGLLLALAQLNIEKRFETIYMVLASVEAPAGGHCTLIGLVTHSEKDALSWPNSELSRIWLRENKITGTVTWSVRAAKENDVFARSHTQVSVDCPEKVTPGQPS